MRDRTEKLAGKARKSAEDSLDAVEAYKIACSIPTAERESFFKPSTFKRGLGGRALDWRNSDLSRDMKKDWERLLIKILERFPGCDSRTLRTPAR